MADPAVLHATLLDRLRTLPTVTAFDADVPDPPPADAQGRSFPYCVVWPSPGGDPFDPALAEHTGGLTWVTQVTVAAGDPGWCLQAAGLVRQALTGTWLADGASPLLDQTPASRTIVRDPAVKPARWFVPLMFGCQIA